MRQKLRTLRVARMVRQGGLLAHGTSTVSGIAANPMNADAVQKLQRFKQRRGPFLLLADSKQTAASLARYLTPQLRQMMDLHWPAKTTLIFPAIPSLPSSCVKKGMVAVRVDADETCRRMASACGGLLLSSSLNRKGQSLQIPNTSLRMSWHRHLSAVLPATTALGQASSLYVIRRHKVRKLR
ncbi:MAG: Sua5/YciO/YrdC/YwlC family protein [Mariprofundaceae bacterium]